MSSAIPLQGNPVLVRDVCRDVYVLREVLLQFTKAGICQLEESLGDIVLARAAAVVALELALEEIRNSGEEGPESDDNSGEGSQGGDERSVGDREEVPERDWKRRRLMEETVRDTEAVETSVEKLEDLAEAMGKRMDAALEKAKDLSGALNEFIVELRERLGAH
ncbi:hypothetical protein P691DRAFT_781767 [Macrolepiota fuliginosa MF-IS2]|uniref:Uncharacterized protein n=1 Tax=Macrolepiota fuliginosa MF-IS2 TaxID=1400762 RepID=A0A9P6C1M0_9AGAR|nr:hypothetical protein P691DRAFT_781767 [Macrolepiota fuliginosa MF-IS2]